MELRFVKIRSQKEQGNFLPKCNESVWAFKFDFLEKFFPQSDKEKSQQLLYASLFYAQTEIF